MFPKMKASAISQIARTKNAKYLVFSTDSWSLAMSEQQKERLKKDKTAEADFLRIANEQGCRAAAAAGYGRLIEAVTVTVQAKHDFYMVMQTYERVTPDGVIPPTAVTDGIPEHEIRFSEQPQVITAADGKGEGRMLSFYEGSEVSA